MIIRRLTKDDLQLRVSWMNNPKVYNSMHFDTPVLMDNTIRWFENNVGNHRRADMAFEENGEVVAFGGLTNIDCEVKKAELYVFVNPEVHKSGIGTRATRALCHYGFNELELKKIYLETNEDNIAAQRVYQKCGFVLEGKLRNEYISKDGRMMCRMYYGLLKGEFQG